MSAFLLEILTPERLFYKASVESVIVKGCEGFLGILARHAPLLSRLSPGSLRITKGHTEQVFNAGAGLVEVTAAGVTVLVDSAEPVSASDAVQTPA